MKWFAYLALCLSLCLVSLATGCYAAEDGPNAPTAAVTYDGNGQTSGSVPVDGNRYRQAQVVTVLGNSGVLARTAFIFSGWNTQADGLGTTYQPFDQFIMGSSAVTLYAIWSAAPTFTVTFDGNGSDGGTVPTDGARYLQGQNVTVPGNPGTLTRAGYSFSGWNTQADGLGTTYTQGQNCPMGAANLVLYARWSTVSPSTYTVTYDGNGSDGGAVPVDTVHYLTGQYATVLGNPGNLTRTGRMLLGWNSQADGLGVTYIAGQTMFMGADRTLYALWSAAGPTVFAAGSYDFQVHQAAYWINDAFTLLRLGDQSVASQINAMVSSGGNLYAAGDYGGTACYWVSGDPNPVMLGAQGSSSARGIRVVGGTIYVAGWDLSSNKQTACYWTIGASTTQTFIGPMGLESGAYGLDVANGDIYVVGWREVDPGGGSSHEIKACYWVNDGGSLTPLAPPLMWNLNPFPNFIAYGIYVDGAGNVHAVGTSMYTEHACYWVNGALAEQSAGQTRGWAITGSPGNVYLAGQIYDQPNGVFRACFWQNVLTNPFLLGWSNEQSEAFAVAVDGSDVYVGGIEHGNAYYWVNGALHNLGTGGTIRALVVAGP